MVPELRGHSYAACGSRGITATAAVVNDTASGLTVYVNAPDGQLYALSAATGATLWHATVDTPSSTADDFYAWGSPLVANGQVYVGIASQCDDPLVPAGVVEFNQDTGAPEGSWQSIPGGQPGGSVWGSPADSTLGDGSVFATTGNALAILAIAVRRFDCPAIWHRPIAVGLLAGAG